MTRYLIAVALFLLAAYGLVEAWPLIAGPSLSIESPRNGAPFPDGIVVTRGNASRIAKLTLNGDALLYDKKGLFSSTLTFPQGGSILTFVATDRFGRSTTVIRTVFVPADASVGSLTSDVGAD